jgi:hypothetical protein
VAKAKAKVPKARSSKKTKKQQAKRSQVPRPWDFWMKVSAKQEPQALVSWLLPGAKFLGTIDKELQGRTVQAGLLFRVLWRGIEIILHIEIQRKDDKNMARRVWVYNVMTRCIEPYPVYSVVIYLSQQGDIAESPYIQEDVPGETAHIFFFRNLKLWEVLPEDFKNEDLAGLLPWLPLLKDGNNRETVEDMIAELKARNRADLLPLGWVFAGLVLEKSEDQEWLRERFNAMRDILDESPVYHWIEEAGIEKGIKKGKQEGQQQALQQMLVRRVKKRFPVLAPLAEERAAQLEDLEVLNNTVDAVNDAETIEEARRILEEGACPDIAD